MSEKKTVNAGESSPKEIILQEVMLQLATNLPSLKESLGEKKFEKRIRKAAKMLTSGINKELPAEKKVAKKSPVKKATKKSPVKKVVKKKTAAPVKKSPGKAGQK